MRPLAVRSRGTGVVDVPAQLAHILDDHVHAVRVALAEMPAARVVRTLSAEAHDAASDVVPAFALRTETVLLELEHRGERECVIGSCYVDVLGAQTRVRPEDFLGVITGDA